MRKLVILLLSAVLFAGCGVGVYTLSSGKADEACLSFTDSQGAPLTVRVDGDDYRLYAVKESSWRRDRDIKATAENTLYLVPGTHNIEVYSGSVRVYSKTIFISAGEHKVVCL